MYVTITGIGKSDFLPLLLLAFGNVVLVFGGKAAILDHKVILRMKPRERDGRNLCP